MRRSPALPLAMLVVVALATAWGFATILHERYAAGASYPVYSSLRTDPLGTKALFEALDRLPGVEATRNYRKLEKLEIKPGTTLMLLHVHPTDLQDGNALNGETLKAFAVSGGRVVLTVDGQASGLNTVKEESEKKRDENARKRLREKLKEDKDKDKKGKEAEADHDKELVDEALFRSSKSVEKLLGVSGKAGKFVLMPRGGYKVEPARNLPLTEDHLPLWHSKTSLEINRADQDRWQVLAIVNEQIVLAEYRIGQGSIVVATDSYFTSNEGLRKEPAPAFLSWLVGGASNVIFDETHLGTQENLGIMTLARRYRLHGMFIGGLVLFALFVWRSATSLLPQREEVKSASRPVAGQGAGAALVSLLKRGIPRSQLLRKGLETWEHHQPSPSPAQKQRLGQAMALLPSLDSKRPRPAVLLETYRRICAALHPKHR